MARFRSELVRGFTVLGIFVILIFTTELFFPYPVEHTRYTYIDLKKIRQNPILFEGHEISSSASVSAIITNGLLSFAEVEGEDGIILVFHSSVGHPEEGDYILFRGISQISSDNSVLIHEFHIQDTYSSTIRSIPGFILFIALFFTVFTIDFDSLAFAARRRQSA